MNSFLKWLAGNSLIRAKIMGMFRHLASTAAGALGLWLSAHGADQSTTADATQGAALLLTAAASYGFSLWDKSNVSDKMADATTAGVHAGQIIQGAAPSPQLQVDQAMTEKVAQAIDGAAAVAPGTKAAALARLESGT